MKNIIEMLDSAREIIDGEMNCHTFEYRAFNLLEQAVRKCTEEISAIIKQIS